MAKKPDDTCRSWKYCWPMRYFGQAPAAYMNRQLHLGGSAAATLTTFTAPFVVGLITWTAQGWRFANLTRKAIKSCSKCSSWDDSNCDWSLCPTVQTLNITICSRYWLKNQKFVTRRSFQDRCGHYCCKTWHLNRLQLSSTIRNCIFPY